MPSTRKKNRHSTPAQRLYLESSEFRTIDVSALSSRLVVTVRANATATLELLTGSRPSNPYPCEIAITLERKSRCSIVQVIRGGTRLECHLSITLAGPGATVQYSGIVRGSRNSYHANYFMVRHCAPRTKSDILIRGTFMGRSKGFISGLIHVEPSAQKAEASFKSHLLLADTGMAITKPALEIRANDVRVSHGATTSSIEEEQLFYLTSRGIPRQRAQQLILRGHLAPVLARIPAVAARTIKRYL